MIYLLFSYGKKYFCTDSKNVDSGDITSDSTDNICVDDVSSCL